MCLPKLLKCNIVTSFDLQMFQGKKQNKNMFYQNY